MDRHKNKGKGFTLVELMIVIVIMVILAAAATPIFTGYMKKARTANYLAECRSIYTAIQTSIEMQRASADHLTAFTLSSIDREALEAEVLSLTTYSIVEVDEDDELSDGETYGYTLAADYEKGGVYCKLVHYNADSDGKWVFNTENSSFREVY